MLRSKCLLPSPRRCNRRNVYACVLTFAGKRPPTPPTVSACWRRPPPRPRAAPPLPAQLLPPPLLQASAAQRRRLRLVLAATPAVRCGVARRRSRISIRCMALGRRGSRRSRPPTGGARRCRRWVGAGGGQRYALHTAADLACPARLLLCGAAAGCVRQQAGGTGLKLRDCQSCYAFLLL